MVKRINDRSSSPSKRMCTSSVVENSEDLTFPEDDDESK